MMLDLNRRTPAEVIALCHNSDLALLKVDEAYVRPALRIVRSSDLKMGASVVTLGYPNSGGGELPQAKLAEGAIQSLEGRNGDGWKFLSSMPTQPGNSGGAVMDSRGNVVGVVSKYLVQPNGLPLPDDSKQRASIAVKSDLLLNLVDSVPGLMKKLVKPAKEGRAAREIITDLQMATILLTVEPAE